tara:strand:- start:249 stop:1082 length:834 start_codon:yes stop_codon:yes gene_type:complete
MLKVSISFDYDTPIGYNESFNIKDIADFSEIEGTDKILNILNKYNIITTFGIVAKIIEHKKYREPFCRQIKNIYEEGHEICSHSYSHKFLPSLSLEDLQNEIILGKQVIENLINDPIIGFIPPFNRPMNYLRKGAISISEIFGLHKRGFGKNSLGKVLRILNENEFLWCRVSFKSKFRQLKNILLSSNEILYQPFYYRSILVIPLHSTGFGDKTTQLIESNLGKNKLICIYAHPHQALNKCNSQSAENMEKMIKKFQSARENGLLDYIAMKDIRKVI